MLTQTGSPGRCVSLLVSQSNIGFSHLLFWPLKGWWHMLWLFYCILPSSKVIRCHQYSCFPAQSLEMGPLGQHLVFPRPSLQIDASSLQLGVVRPSLPFDTLHKHGLPPSYLKSCWPVPGKPDVVHVFLFLECVMLWVSQITFFLDGLGQMVIHRGRCWGEICIPKYPDQLTSSLAIVCVIL